MDSDTTTTVIDHLTIGRIRGIKYSEASNRFLGMQYATLKDRFSRAELVRYSDHDQARASNGILDATKFGPVGLISPNACELEQGLVQKALPFVPLPISDTECLTLNITAPSLASTTSQAYLLPVLAFVHGGGFTTGSSSFPQNELARITEVSIQAGMPMISVNINYRVGAPGFLHSPDMAAVGYRSNNGLQDQRLALYWIQEHIAGFGGDPQRVTYLGESAGATSGFYHLHNPGPYFHQFVSMSGTALLRPRPTAAVHISFQRICEALGAKDEDSPRVKVNRLVNTPSEDFVTRTARPYILGPIVDEEIIPRVTTFESLREEAEFVKLFPGVLQCKRLLIGDCQFDGMIWASRLAGREDVFPRTLLGCLAEIFDPIDPSVAERLARAYHLDASTPINTPETTQSVLEFGNDITFFLPAREFAKAWARSVPSSDQISGRVSFLYHFNASNPWPGPWTGQSTHDLDLMFALQNYREHLSPGQQRCGDKVALDLIRFVHGEDPWPAFDAKGSNRCQAMVYSAPTDRETDESEYVDVQNEIRCRSGNVDGFDQLTGRRTLIQMTVKEQYFDRLFDAWNLFMLGPR
ncbi:uncharacterized protein Z520_11269 [Fonsecaea multimorphosa CBS 102226]|uniref:Carboxylesterase type B domain-containing protein n=1 Tax=Fonsecaea multimorphosa CBS 102226 TaxID=1442371 RepID=A0A0D2I700_9EURO|nr:uncharacterized protein Z520_11269 [Fonsecaea multimorphosa CBS 102226]KIX92996.1 hypothetical protein Z520_11269 [Fonsecaea multimorphosa CBS 102226]OAL18244.1 hypothetical protein AYO22_10822 [Fonsecaea multimorphosa]